MGKKKREKEAASKGGGGGGGGKIPAMKGTVSMDANNPNATRTKKRARKMAM